MVLPGRAGFHWWPKAGLIQLLLCEGQLAFGILVTFVRARVGAK